MDDRIKLDSPFPIYAVPRVFSWMQQNWDKVADDFAPPDVHSFVEDWRRKERAGRRSWAVLNDGELVGVVLSARISPIAADLHFVFRRDFWGRGNTVPALELACAEIFNSGVEKISSLAFPHNRALIGIAMANGATNEGTLRRHTRKNGKLVDLLLLGFTKEAFDGGSTRRRLQQSGHERQIQQLDNGHTERHEHDGAESIAGTIGPGSDTLQNHHADDAEPAGVCEPVAAGGR